MGGRAVWLLTLAHALPTPNTLSPLPCPSPPPHVRACVCVHVCVLRAPRTRLVIIGLKGGPKVTADLSRVMLKRLTVTGSTLRSRSTAFKAALADAVRVQVFPLVGRGPGRVAPVMDSEYGLEEVAAAHTRLESRSHFGKTVLRVFGDSV